MRSYASHRGGIDYGFIASRLLGIIRLNNLIGSILLNCLGFVSGYLNHSIVDCILAFKMPLCGSEAWCT